jgi:transposase
VVEGIVFRYRTGVPWRDLPERFGPWQTVGKRHHRFATDGTWRRVLAAAQAAGEIDWNVSVDSTIVRAHQHSATAKREDRVGPASTQGAASMTRIRAAAGMNQATTLVSVAIVSNRTPSRDRPTTLAYPRPRSTGRRSR